MSIMMFFLLNVVFFLGNAPNINAQELSSETYTCPEKMWQPSFRAFEFDLIEMCKTPEGVNTLHQQSMRTLQTTFFEEYIAAPSEPSDEEPVRLLEDTKMGLGAQAQAVGRDIRQFEFCAHQLCEGFYQQCTGLYPQQRSQLLASRSACVAEADAAIQLTRHQTKMAYEYSAVEVKTAGPIAWAQGQSLQLSNEWIWQSVSVFLLQMRDFVESVTGLIRFPK